MQKILFNDKYGLTKAVLEGRKTQTRRIAYADYIRFPNTCIGLKDYNRNKLFLKDGSLIVARSHYKIGEEIAVAQSYDKFATDIEYDSVELKKMIRSEGWKNKMFVKADLMPHRIRITNIRAERLQYISDEDCIAEGIKKNPEVLRGMWEFSYIKGETLKFEMSTTPREAYAKLVDHISGKSTWESNPYVFVYEFELIK